MLCCDVGTLTSGVMLCYVCYVVTCHTAQRDTPRDRVSIVTLRQCHHMPQSGLHYAVVVQKVASELHPKVRNHGEGPD